MGSIRPSRKAGGDARVGAQPVAQSRLAASAPAHDGGGRSGRGDGDKKYRTGETCTCEKRTRASRTRDEEGTEGGRAYAAGERREMEKRRSEAFP